MKYVLSKDNKKPKHGFWVETFGKEGMPTKPFLITDDAYLMLKKHGNTVISLYQYFASMNYVWKHRLNKKDPFFARVSPEEIFKRAKICEEEFLKTLEAELGFKVKIRYELSNTQPKNYVDFWSPTGLYSCYFIVEKE